MKIKIKTLLLILVIAILSLVMISCDRGMPQPPPTGGEGPGSPIVRINKNDMFVKISQGMLIGAERLEESDEKFVSTEYTIHTGHINYTVVYKANYAPRRQDSEIYLKIFDNHEHMNRVFIYYNKGDLFMQTMDNKRKMEGFGSTNMFDLFFEIVTMFDMSDTFIGEPMSALFDPENVGANLYPLVDQSRMSYIIVTDTAESIEMTHVDLNYGQIKQQVNDLIKNTFEKFEDKFDLLSLKYFGFRISELSYMEIATMMGDLINIRLEDGGVQGVIFKASGTMADTINDFTLDLEVQARPGKGEIKIDDTENPYLLKYEEIQMGRLNYGGTLYVPFFDMTYDATLRTILSSTDNTVNQVLFTIESVQEYMGGLFYKDQILYIEITGMQNQLGGAIELQKLNLPKVKFDNIDLAQEITLLFNDLLRIVRTLTEEDIYGENEELLLTVLEHIESDEENNTIYIRITKELIEQMYGEDMDLAQIIANKLGVPKEMINQLLGDDALENATLIFSYNVENGDIGLDLYDGDSLVFELRLSVIDPLPGDTLKFPPSFNPNTFYYMEMPDNTILTLEGELSMQEVSSVKFDELFGALMGDISGVNTPFTLMSYETLNFVLDIMQIYEYTEDEYGQLQREIESVLKFELYKKDTMLLGVYSAKDPAYLLVDFNFPVGPKGFDPDGEPYDQSALRYKIQRSKVVEAFNELLGEDNIFGLENVMDLLNRLISSLKESPSMMLRFYDNSLAFNLVADTVHELIGIDNLNASLKARVRFATTAEEYLNIDISEDLFPTPNVRPLVEETFESIYTTRWQDFVYVYFGDNLMRLKLTYLEDSVMIQTGQVYYQPTAKILDKMVSYFVRITDHINGIKVVKRALDPDMPNNQDAVLTVDRPLKIDPSIDDKLPDRIPVLYDDNTFGYVGYVIEGFDSSNINISGMPRQEYWLVIGKGSVAEIRFYISVEVLGRVIIPLKQIINGQQAPLLSDLQKPVVAEVTIDPYTYAVRRLDDPEWHPLPSSLELKFESVDGVEMGDTVILSDIDWDFDLNKIKFNGGVYFSHAPYNKLTIAIKINIKSKVVAYLRFVDKINTHLPLEQRPFTEEIGLYTVDVLQTDTYVFPVQSTQTQELRLYFEDGTYRVIAPRDYSVNPNEYYSNYLPITLNWKHAEVNPSTVRIQGTHAPLGIEDRDINTSMIEKEDFTVGTQEISLRIIMPSRALATIGIAGNVYAITGYNRLGDGSLNFEDPIRQMMSYHNVAFSQTAALGEFFLFNPYNQEPLPDTVYMEVTQGGENRIQRKAYSIKWIESDVLTARHTYDSGGNILFTQYWLRHVSANEENLFVKGVIGDGDVTIEVNMIVKNLDAVYQDITFEGMDINVTQKTIDPYLSYTLPSYYTLMLRNGNQIFVDNVEWFIMLEEGQEWMLQLDGRNYSWIFEYLRRIDQGLGNPASVVPDGFNIPSQEEEAYFRLLIEKGEIPIDSRYVFPHQGGSFILKTYIEATQSIIEQEISLTINVMPRTVIITDPLNEYTRVDIHNTSSSQPQDQYNINTYSYTSRTMLERLLVLLKLNDEYDKTIGKINILLTALRKANPDMTTERIYAYCYDEYYAITALSERTLMTQRYNYYALLNPTATEEQNKYNALLSYISIKNDEIAQARIGIFFGDNPETSSQRYQLNVKWINLEEIIAVLESSSGAILGVTLEGYIGYGQVNQQTIRVPFYVTRKEIVTFNFNRMRDYDPTVMSVDYRYVYISDEQEAVDLIYNIMDQYELFQDKFSAIYNHDATTDIDRQIMDEMEESIWHENPEIRYELILNELIDRRLSNIRTVFIDVAKPLGFTQIDERGEEVFIAPSEYFYDVLSEVSLMFADETDGYFSPRFSIGEGATLEQQKRNFDAKFLATDPEVYDVRIDETTQIRYAYLDVEMSHLSSGSCRYPITVKFKVIVDQINVVYGEPSLEDLEPFDEYGNARYPEGFNLPGTITVNYTYSGDVVFGNITNWVVASPIPGFQEGQIINRIPETVINVLNPAIMNFTINLPCEQGEFTYNVTFPRKYIGMTKYNAYADDRNFSMLDIRDGIIEIDNLYEIYDPSQPLGFDTSKLPRTIRPYTYEFGEVQYDIGSMVIDTYYDTTLNNAFEVEWRLVDEWTGGRRIDHNGTGEPELFATARIFSYYYYEDIDSVYPIRLDQEIQLYIKVKPLKNPVIEYEGLVEYNDKNNISFDPYDDINNYGGNLVLPKDGLAVYFNNSLNDVHIFEARDLLTYYLIMADAKDTTKAYLFDSLIQRAQTTDTERKAIFNSLINEKVKLYGDANDLSQALANESLYALGFNALVQADQLTLEQRQRQREFLFDFMTDFLSANYNLTASMAWLKLLEDNPLLTKRAPIIYPYLANILNMSAQEIIEDLEVLTTSYDSFIENTITADKALILENYLLGIVDTIKDDIIYFLDDNGLYQSEREFIRNDIINHGGEPNNVEIFNRLMNMISIDNAFGILLLYEQDDNYTKSVAIATNTAVEDVAKGLLFEKLVEVSSVYPSLLNSISVAIATEIEDWQLVSAQQRAWRCYAKAIIGEGIYIDIMNVFELYMSLSVNNTVNRLKHLTVSRLLNVYDYNDNDMSLYFGEQGDKIAYRFVDTINKTIDELLEDWQITRAKTIVWDDIANNLIDDDILARILEGDPNGEGRINTQPLRALAYERLKLSDEKSLFEPKLSTLEQEYGNITDDQVRRSTIFNELYTTSSLEEKVILIQFLMAAARSVSDSEQHITVVPYTQAGHAIPQILDHILKLYLLLPDGQRIDITLNIFSRQIKNVLIPNAITNIEDGEVITTYQKLPNIYYIDPYNSETFRLPMQAEFEFETGYNLTLDINEWVDYDENIFYTRSPESQLQKIFYYRLSPDSYKGGIYQLESYLTYGIGEDVERQRFYVTIIVLNRTLSQEYDQLHHFDNPISGRVEDIPYLLTEDMFVDYELYYKGIVEPEYWYSNFGMPVVPQINWHKTALNPNGILDSDILTQGGFVQDVQGLLHYENTMLFKTYEELWQEVYTQYSQAAKPIAWENFFEVTYSGERIVKTIFAGEAALQIKALDEDIFNEMIIDAYYEMYDEASPDFRAVIDYLMIAFRNNNFGLIPDPSSDLWYVAFYKELDSKAFVGTLTEDELEVYTAFNELYQDIHQASLIEKRAEKWDALFEMTGIWQGQQQQIALGYLTAAYDNFREDMLVSIWERLTSMVSEREYEVMNSLIDTLSDLYGSIEKAKARAWDFLINDDRVKNITGEKAKVQITAKKWDFIELMDMAEEVIKIITFNPFTKKANTDSFIANFEVLNTLLIDELGQALEETKEQYIESFRDEALNLLKTMLMQRAIEEVSRIDQNNQTLPIEERAFTNWNDLYQEYLYKATSPIDNTRAEVELAYGGSLTEEERDEIVWQRLWEGAEEWQDVMAEIFNQFEGEENRYQLSIDRYREKRIELLTFQLDDIYEETYREKSLDAWNGIVDNPVHTTQDLLAVVLKDVKREAWVALYENYSNPTEQLQMPTHLDQSHGDLQFAKAWDSYYSVSSADRKALMDKILLYYGFNTHDSSFGGLGEVFEYIMLTSEVGEQETLTEIYQIVYSELKESKGGQEPGQELVVVEVMIRLRNYYGEAITDICKILYDEIKRDAWDFLLEISPEYEELEDMFLPDNDIKTYAWQKLWAIREGIAYHDYAIIDNIYQMVIEEHFDNQLAWAFDSLDTFVNNPQWLDKKEEILDNLDKDDIKTILWQKLYQQSSEHIKESMDATLNIVNREGLDNAHAIAWERFINKNEIPQSIKDFMWSMYDSYTKARAMEEYKEWYTRIVSQELETNYQDIYDELLERYKKSKVWQELYSQADAERKALMDGILLDIISEHGDCQQERLEALALDELMEQVPEEKDGILLLVESAIPNFEYAIKINEFKAKEWDDFYANADSVRRSQMNVIINNYSGIPVIVNRKAAALDDENFRGLLSSAERNALDQRISAAKQEIERLYFSALAYDQMVEDEIYKDELESTYNFLYEKYLMLYYPNRPQMIDEVIIKTMAYDRLVAEIRNGGRQDIEEFISAQLVFVDEDYLALTWDGYYQYNLNNDFERAQLMLNILNQTVDIQMDLIRVNAIDRLYDLLWNGAVYNIIEEREELIESIQKSRLWQGLFGDDLFALKGILNQILTIDDGQISLKSQAWLSLSNALSVTVDYYNIMNTIRTQVRNDFPSYTDNQIDRRSWEIMYADAEGALKYFMDTVWNEVNGGQSIDLHLVWQEMYSMVSSDNQIYLDMTAIYNYVHTENPNLPQQEKMALAFDLASEDYALLIERLNEYVYEYKSQAWVELNEYFSEDAVMTALFEEMFAFQILHNEETLSQALCWDRMVNMVFEIEATLERVDPRFDEDQLRMFALDVILDLLNMTERAVLENAASAIEVELTQEEIDSLIYDKLYKSMTPKEKEALSNKKEEAELLYPEAQENFIKHIALSLYMNSARERAVQDLNELSLDMFSLSFVDLDYNQKLELFEQVHKAKTNNLVTVYTIEYALEKWQKAQIDTEYARTNIFWDPVILEQGGDIGSIYIGNAYKSYDPEEDLLKIDENLFEGYDYTYRNRQIIIEYLDFYGELNIYADDVIIGTETYYNQLVIDPLSPIIPDKAAAYGIISGMEPDVEINGQMYNYIGMVDVSYENLIYQFTYDSEGIEGIELTATVSPSMALEEQDVTITVYYLDRSPLSYYVNTQNYTNEQRDMDLNLYPLRFDPVSNTNVMTIDPLNESIYNSIEGRYILPNSIVVFFTDAYPDGVIATLFMNGVFNNRMDMTDIEWNLLGNQITLAGFEASDITIDSYTVDNQTRESAPQMNAEFWKVRLEVTPREVDRILQVNAQGMGGELFAIYEDGMLKARNKIDPYNVALSFPDHVRVEFVGSGDMMLLNNIQWRFADGRGLEYLQLPQVITGEIGEAAMFLIAGFTVVSETIWVNFPIKPRHIDISVGGGADIKPLDGGIIYLIKGQPVQPQLDRFNSLYYNFGGFGEGDDWSEVPLEFIANDVSQISTAEVGVYTLRGRLGPINDPNINFEVIVIDPKLYAEFEEQINYKVYYDRISVAVNTYGMRISGKEEEEGFLPDKFVQQQIRDSSGNLISGYNEFQIIGREWDIANKEVRFICIYTFLMDYHDVERLGGIAAGSREQTLVITLPLDTYIYTEVDSSMSFNIEDNTLYLPLGEELIMSAMPKAIMNRGTDNEFEVPLLWDLREINVNRAGVYYLYGYFRDYTSSHMARNKSLRVVIDRLDISDEIATQDALLQTYNGLYQVVVPVIPDVLRENGVYAQFPRANILVEYITEERYNAGDYGDFRTTPYRNAGVYYVRITIDDYNVWGERLFKLTINPIVVDPDDLSFEYGQGSVEISVPIPNWPQSEIEKERLFYDQFRVHANYKFGVNVESRASSAAFDTLYQNTNQIGKELLDWKLEQVLEEQFPNYENSSPQEQAAILVSAKAIIWTEILPTGFEERPLVDHWPLSQAKKDELLDIAKDQLYENGENEDEELVKTQALDNLYEIMEAFIQDIIDNRVQTLIYENYPNFDSMSDSMKSFIIIETKATVWDEIIPTGLRDYPLISGWPLSVEEKMDILNAEYMLILNQSLAGEEKDFFIMQVKAMAYDHLESIVYSSAQQMLANTLQSAINMYFPLYDEYDAEQKALVLIEVKSIVWNQISPDDRVIERSYIYDGKIHMPEISGLPEVKIPNWPETLNDKNALLDYAMRENANFTLEQAKARAFDNLMQTIFSNIYALQKMNAILDDVILTFFPEYHYPDTSYEQRQAILTAAKAMAWDNRIIPGDTVMEIDYAFEFWYVDMENNDMIIETRPREAGTYEITLTIPPETNPNYVMKEGEEVVITISIRRAQINQNFANWMTYTGKPILPRCEGLHDANGNLPAGVTIEYKFWKDGEPVDYIRNAGQYTFSAVVQGGNNYPSWTVEAQTINILPKEMSIEVGTVESDYLQEVRDFASSISLYGIVGDDLPSMFGYLVCESEVTSRHMVGEYPIRFVGFKQTFDSDKVYYLNAERPEDDVINLDPVLFGNYNITAINGIYRINKAVQDAIIIHDEEELHQRYGLMQEGDTQVWYLAPGFYGDFVVDKNVGITLIGSYDTSAEYGDFSSIEDMHDKTMNEVKDNSQNIATVFNSIRIERGAVTIDIIRFNGDANHTSVYVNRNASSVEIKRSYFKNEEILAPGGMSEAQNARAIVTAPMFAGLLRLDRTYIEGFSIGVYMDGGQTLEVVNSRFNSNNYAALMANKGNTHIEGSRFEFTRGHGVYLQMSLFTAINCSFYANNTGLASLSVAHYDILLENIFMDNVTDIETL